MTTFIESPRFPDAMAYYAQGGAEFNTTIIQLNSGFEQRNTNWTQSRAMYTIQAGMRTQEQPIDSWNLNVSNSISFFRAMKGRSYGFRFKDFQDYLVTQNNGILEQGFGLSIPVYQLYKNYFTGSLVDTKKIVKPVQNKNTIYRNGTTVIFGTNPGNCSIDTTKGLITFVPDISASISSISISSNPVLSTNSNHGFSSGQTLYLTGLNTGNLLNNTAVVITVLTATTLTLNSVANLAVVNQGTINLYAQSTETLKWSGEFDLACRFDNDNITYDVVEGGLIEINNMKIVEIRV